MILNATGGGRSGAVLTVSGVVGSTITAAKDGKSFSRTADSSGTAVFKGLESGEWTLTMTSGGETATRTITITADYSITITFFSATINITYPAGSTCKVMNGTTTLTAPDTTGTWSCIVPSAGTWTVTCTDGTNTKSESVEITSEGQSESVTLSYQLILFDGGVVEPWTVIQAKPTATISDIIYLYASDPSRAVVSAVRTENKIDVSGYSTLKTNVTKHTKTGAEFICLTSSTDAPINPAAGDNTVTSAVAAHVKVSTTGEVLLDVSNLQGEYYVSLATGHYGANGFEVNKVMLN